MKTFVLLIILLSNQASAGFIPDQILHLKSLICPSCPVAEIFYSVNSSAPFLEEVLVDLLRRTAVNIYTELDRFREITLQRWAFAVLLMDHVPSCEEFMRYDSGIRTVAVVRGDLVDQLVEALVDLDVYHVMYVVYDEGVLGYFDRFRRKMFWYAGVEVDLFRETDRDMMGLRFAVMDADPVDEYLFESIAEVCNASLIKETRKNSEVHVRMYHDMCYVLEDDPDMIPHLLSMHRFHNYKLMVPQSEQKLLLSVLSDPFDRYVWISNFCSVFVLALFVKVMRDRRIRWTRICDLFVKLLGVGLMGSLIQLRCDSERFSVGLYMLISIVLVSAYQSLVISFLLSRRYYPELDNLQQVNATCRWIEDDDNHLLRDAGFLHYGECNDQFSDDVDIFDQVLSLYRQKCCMEVSDAYYQSFVETFSINSGFRLSKLVTRQMPVFAGLDSHSPLHDTVKWFATAFHEANLYFFVEADRFQDPAKHHSFEASPVQVQDLSLVWILYGLGISLCLICIICEKFVNFLKNVRK